MAVHLVHRKVSCYSISIHPPTDAIKYTRNNLVRKASHNLVPNVGADPPSLSDENQFSTKSEGETPTIVPFPLTLLRGRGTRSVWILIQTR
jgi:hypothetical protein